MQKIEFSNEERTPEPEWSVPLRLQRLEVMITLETSSLSQGKESLGGLQERRDDATAMVVGGKTAMDGTWYLPPRISTPFLRWTSSLSMMDMCERALSKACKADSWYECQELMIQLQRT